MKKWYVSRALKEIKHELGRHLGKNVPDRKDNICNDPEMKMCLVSSKNREKTSQIRIDSGGKLCGHKDIINNFYWIVNEMRNRWKDLSKR